MTENQRPKDLNELITWLEADDAKGREIRAGRLRELLEILPIPAEGMSYMGGEESIICLDEIRRCYMDGSYMAVVLLCLMYVERELAASLYGAGWEPAKNARLGAVLEKARDDGILSDFDWDTFNRLASLRNSHAHFRGPLSSTSLMARTVEEDALSNEVLLADAKSAIQALARIVKRQSGLRVVLDPPDEL